MARFVITGGPCCGKTTTINSLRDLGYCVVPEAATTIIEEEQDKPNPVLPWTNLAAFQEKVAALQLDLESKVKTFPAFFDRGIIDNIGYCNEGNIPIPPYLVLLANTHRYDTIFILTPLMHYENTTVRKEDPRRSKSLHAHIHAAYCNAGYTPIEVPLLAPDQRAQFIIDAIKHDTIKQATQQKQTTP